jgi:hypothetical protein
MAHDQIAERAAGGAPAQIDGQLGLGLDELAEQIWREMELAELRWKDALGHAIRAGELLIAAKAQVKHGEWLPWLSGCFPGSERTAQRYMSLARESARVADLPTVRDAVALLMEPKQTAAGESREAKLARARAEVADLEFLVELDGFIDEMLAKGRSNWEAFSVVHDANDRCYLKHGGDPARVDRLRREREERWTSWGWERPAVGP